MLGDGRSFFRKGLTAQGALSLSGKYQSRLSRHSVFLHKAAGEPRLQEIIISCSFFFVNEKAAFRAVFLKAFRIFLFFCLSLLTLTGKTVKVLLSERGMAMSTASKRFFNSYYRYYYFSSGCFPAFKAVCTASGL
jgi:hypothetical protein